MKEKKIQYKQPKKIVKKNKAKTKIFLYFLANQIKNYFQGKRSGPKGIK